MKETEEEEEVKVRKLWRASPVSLFLCRRKRLKRLQAPSPNGPAQNAVPSMSPTLARHALYHGINT
jgi:hypothetical protein